MSTSRNNTPEPSRELINKALDCLERKGRAQFATHLETARTMWRQYQALVEAEEFPAELRADYVKETGVEPSDDCDVRSETLALGYRRSLRRDALEIARCWAARGQGSRRGDGRRLKIVSKSNA